MQRSQPNRSDMAVNEAPALRAERDRQMFRSRQDGRAVQDWLQAERKIRKDESLKRTDATRSGGKTMTNMQPQQRYEIGMVSLGVMECNLLRNMADHGLH